MIKPEDKVLKNYIEMGNRIRMLRREMKMNQSEIAKFVGVSLPTWQNYEYGHTAPNPNVMKRFCDLKISTNWLLTGNGSMKDNSVVREDNADSFFKSYKETVRPVNQNDTGTVQQHHTSTSNQRSMCEKSQQNIFNELLKEFVGMYANLKNTIGDEAFIIGQYSPETSAFIATNLICDVAMVESEIPTLIRMAIKRESLKIGDIISQNKKSA